MTDAESKPADRKPIAWLKEEAASRTNVTLFDHSFDDNMTTAPPAAAARYLVGRQAFSIGFGKSSPFYFSDSPLIRGFTVLVCGENLFETLALNAIQLTDNTPIPRRADDLPAWDQDDPVAADDRGTRPRGYLDYLTWQSRHIHLIPEGNPVGVRECQMRQNLKLPKDWESFDPFKCYRKVEDRGWLPRSFEPDKALWRDSHILFQSAADDAQGRRPVIFNWLARIDQRRRDGLVDARPAYSVAAFGLATEHPKDGKAGKAAKVILWRHERLPLPLAYLQDAPLLDKLRLALDLAEKIGEALRKSTLALATLLRLPQFDPQSATQRDQEQSKPLSKGIKQQISRIESSISTEHMYWSRLDTHFKALLMKLATEQEIAAGGAQGNGVAIREWCGHLRRAGEGAFGQMAHGLAQSARSLRALAEAEQFFVVRLDAVLRKHEAARAPNTRAGVNSDDGGEEGDGTIDDDGDDDADPERTVEADEPPQLGGTT